MRIPLHDDDARARSKATHDATYHILLNFKGIERIGVKVIIIMVSESTDKHGIIHHNTLIINYLRRTAEVGEKRSFAARRTAAAGFQLRARIFFPESNMIMNSRADVIQDVVA